MKEFSYEDIEAATNGFALDRLIGKGSHGYVYKATLRGGNHVAVKKPSQGVLQLNQDKEIDILSSSHCPHLVNLLGVSRTTTDQPNKLLVMEFMPNGTLHDLLHVSSSSSPPPSWPRRISMALQVACAVQFLHEAAPPIIHRDIKSANILLDGRWNARLADFSLAVRKDPAAAAMPAAAGTIGYIDPSYTVPEKLSFKTDVFSFGVVLLELVSGRPAMDMTREPASIVSWAVPMIRAGRAAEVCDGRVGMSTRCMERVASQVLGVAARCVAAREERRPTVAEVVGELQGVVELVWWPIWSPLLRGKVCMRSSVVYRCVRRAWRRRCTAKTTKVTASTITILTCKDHLDDDDHA